jgi:MoaA/NifB/PqqE/SkfB family radical SAM enzyme
VSQIPADLRAILEPYLPLLGAGFGGITGSEGRYHVPMAARGEFRLPEGTRSLFLRLGCGSGPARIAFRDARGELLLRATVEEEGTWLCVPSGAGALAFAVESGEVRLLDLEPLAEAPRPHFDLEAARERRDRFLTLRMDLTNKCNLRCRMCALSFDEVFYQPKDLMDLETFARFAAEVLPFASHLSLSAGYEPLLHPDFPEVLREASRHGVPYLDFTTNGTLITRELVDAFIDHGVSTVTFSIDGAQAGTYEHIRRGARWERFLAGLETFAGRKRERGSDRPLLSFNMVLMRRNVDELAEVLRLGARYGLRLMHTSLLVPHPGLRMENEALQHDRARANRAFEEARRTAAELGIEAFLPADFDLSLPEEPVEVPGVDPGLTLCEEWMGARAGDDFRPGGIPGGGAHERPPPRAAGAGQDSWAEAAPAGSPAVELQGPAPSSALLLGTAAPAEGQSMVRPGSATRDAVAHDGDGTPVDAACPYPWTMAVLRHDGTVVPCCHWMDPEVMGRIPDQGFAEVWNGPAFQRLRLELATRRFRPTCEVCPERRRI